MEQLLASSLSMEENVEELRSFYQRVAQERTWPLLLLEFKLFAIRHPASKARLESMLADSLSPKDEARISRILGPAPKGGLSRVAAVQSLQPLVSALALEVEFDGAFGRESIKKVVDEVFDVLLGVKQGIRSRE